MPSARVEKAKELIRYNRVVFDRFEASARRRGWAAAVADRGTGHLSIKDTLVHILNVHEAWLVAIPKERWGIFEQPGRQGPAIRSWRAFAAYRERVWDEVDGFVRTLTDRSLSVRLKAPWMKGTYTLEDAVYQATLEQAHHLGEVIGVYWQNDWTPPPMTWIETARAPRRARAR